MGTRFGWVGRGAPLAPPLTGTATEMVRRLIQQSALGAASCCRPARLQTYRMNEFTLPAPGVQLHRTVSSSARPTVSD